ncbi:Uncharacterized protein HZ326_26961 [Fusarium oxysporum f. sp. albedinis]|nr:Uncharacterized protein HZ326_26961 [Fusarium oxysporum f. sp. albedinis]
MKILQPGGIPKLLVQVPSFSRPCIEYPYYLLHPNYMSYVWKSVYSLLQGRIFFFFTVGYELLLNKCDG